MTAPSPSPSPLPSVATKPVRKLSNAAASAISAGETAFHTLASQVGGHPGVLASEDNALIVKASLPPERAFYELLAQEHLALVYLQNLVPKFYGTLRLEGRVAAAQKGLRETGGDAAVSAGLGLEQDVVVPIPEVQEKDEYIFSIVLENISSVFTKPNIMDVKLGTMLYDENATQEKKEHMLETATNTTSLETGIRLTGFQVYDHTAGEAIVTPKSYGKSIKVSDLPEGVRQFFPISSSPADSTTPEGQGLPLELLLPITRGILDDVRAVREALAKTELRMVGGSLLIVYEADWTAARAALDAQAAARATLESAAASQTELTNSAGFGIGATNEDEEGYDSDIDSEDEDAPANAVKLIDFAHTRLTPGEGPDEGVLKGVDTVMRLFEGRVSELEALIDVV